MTEADWLTKTSISWLVRLLPDDPEPSERKQRLFGVACCRRAAERVEHPDLPPVIEACERAADDRIWQSRLHSLVRNVRPRIESPPSRGEEPDDLFWLANAVCLLADWPTSVVQVADNCCDALCGHDDFVAGHGEALYQADLFRDIFANPFRPISLETTLRSTNAVGLARAMYKSRDFAAMPVLSDALEEAGCDSPDLLAHCRNPDQVHVCGCWVVDLVLGKS